MGKTLREVIRDTTSEHLDAGHLVMGQCLSAVGWVGGTLPERGGMTELPCADVAGSGFAVGAALAGRRPIYVVRYQGFQWLNASFIVNYAAKSKALFGRPCPLLVRSIAMEGGIGPVAGSSHHSLFTRMPGVKVLAPMTPGEWRVAYDEWMAGDDVVYLSEHRGAYNNNIEHVMRNYSVASITLLPISITRFAAIQAAEELWQEEHLAVAVHHISQLKPLRLPDIAYHDASLARGGGIVIDDDYPGGVASDIAMQLHAVTGAQMRVLGLRDRTAGFAARVDNLPPDKERIKQFIQETLNDS